MKMITITTEVSRQEWDPDEFSNAVTAKPVPNGYIVTEQILVGDNSTVTIEEV